jgi:hypothetical protein
MSSCRHPWTGGLTERVNITFQKLLRCFRFCNGLDRTAMLPLVEFAYNSAHALGIERTISEVDFGFAIEEPQDMLFNMRPSSPVFK